MTIPLFTLVGTMRVLTGDDSTPIGGVLLTFTSNIGDGELLSLDDASQLIAPKSVQLDSDGKINGDTGVQLLANDPVLGLSTPLEWTVSAQYPRSAGSDRRTIRSWTFEAPAAGQTQDLADALPVVGSVGQGVMRGDPGPANELSVGTVTGGAVASATITGESPEQVLNLVLPSGPMGWGHGAPGAGVPTDRPYLNVDTGEVLEYRSGAWVLILGLKGPKGDTGDVSRAQLTAATTAGSRAAARLFGLSTTLYLSDSAAMKIWKITPDGAKTDMALTGLVNPRDLALDSAGNLYVVNGSDSDGSKRAVFKVTPDGAQSTLNFGGLGAMWGVAVGADGTVYAPCAPTVVRKLTASGTLTNLPFTGLSSARSIAVDSVGNVFLLDLGLKQVLKLTPAGVQTTLTFTGLTNPYDIAIDDEDNLYVTGYNTASIIKMTPAGVQTSILIAAGSQPIGVTVDGFGNIYAASTNTQKTYRIDATGTATEVPVTGLSSLRGIAVKASVVPPMAAPQITVPKLIMTSPNGTRYTVTVADNGTLTTSRY